MSDSAELIAIEEEWARAIVDDDAGAVATFVTDDWVIVGAEGHVIDGARFLELIDTGALTHDRMEFADWRVRQYGGCAVATSEAWSNGTYLGEAFATHERSTSVYVERKGRWLCVLTHLTAIP